MSGPRNKSRRFVGILVGIVVVVLFLTRVSSDKIISTILSRDCGEDTVNAFKSLDPILTYLLLGLIMIGVYLEFRGRD
jgi:hypothetical protein